jgi:hypothetical protein
MQAIAGFDKIALPERRFWISARLSERFVCVSRF